MESFGSAAIGLMREMWTSAREVRGIPALLRIGVFGLVVIAWAGGGALVVGLLGGAVFVLTWRAFSLSRDESVAEGERNDLADFREKVPPKLSESAPSHVLDTVIDDARPLVRNASDDEAPVIPPQRVSGRHRRPEMTSVETERAPGAEVPMAHATTWTPPA